MQSRSSAKGHHHGMENSNPNNNGIHLNPPTPLFERLVTEEVQELKSCLRMIDNQQRRLNELERVHGDLETRLEQESRGRAQLETTLEQREREWASKFKELELDRDHWKEIVKQEKAKNAKLIHQVVRKDQDIHRMLQRKYDKKGDSPNTPHSLSTRNVRQLSSERPPGPGQLQVGSDTQSTTNNNYRSGVGEQQQYKSPHEILAASGSMEARDAMGSTASFYFTMRTRNACIGKNMENKRWAIDLMSHNCIADFNCSMCFTITLSKRKQTRYCAFHYSDWKPKALNSPIGALA